MNGRTNAGVQTEDIASGPYSRPGMSGWLLVACLLVACQACQGDASESNESSATDDQRATAPDADGSDDEASEDIDTEKSREDWDQQVEAALERGAERRERDAGTERRIRGAIDCELFPDSCREGMSCFVSAEGLRQCAAYDPSKSVGDECRSAEDCDAGQQCVGGSPGRCLEACDPSNREEWGCPLGRRCVAVVGEGGRAFDWGVCREVGDRCQPWPADDCEVGEACRETRLGWRCRNYDLEASSGDRCEQPSDCRRAQTCVRERDGDGSRCRRRCDDQHPCGTGDCLTIEGRPFGFCAGEAAETGGGEEASGETQPPSIVGY
jgi:hypothetical protein